MYKLDGTMHAFLIMHTVITTQYNAVVIVTYMLWSKCYQRFGSLCRVGADAQYMQY